MLSYHFEGVPRAPLGVALKNILTLGIHSKVWLYRVNREMDGHEGFHIDLRWLGVMVALPIITPIIVKFQTARRLNQMVSHQVTVPLIRANRLGWISIIPVFGAGFYAWWVQSTLNKHWFHHRRVERIKLAQDRIAAIEAEAEPEPALVEKKEALQADVARLEQEIEEEIEAARIRWGEERFEDRKKRADLHAAQGARMSRTEIAKLRAEEKKHRKAAKAAKKAARGRLFGLVPAKTAEAEGAGPDPENDADWEPTTPLPERMPEEIEALANAEGREPTPEEQKELKAAQKQLAKREKEAERLQKQRDKLRETLEKQRVKAEQREAKERLKAEKAAEKAERKAQKEAEGKGKKPAKPKKEKKPKKAKKGKGEAAEEAEKIPVTVKPRKLRAPAMVHEVGEGPLRTLTVTCPRCRTEIEGIQKRGDAPAKITCPTCQLVGKV